MSHPRRCVRRDVELERDGAGVRGVLDCRGHTLSFDHHGRRAVQVAAVNGDGAGTAGLHAGGINEADRRCLRVRRHCQADKCCQRRQKMN